VRFLLVGNGGGCPMMVPLVCSPFSSLSKSSRHPQEHCPTQFLYCTIPYFSTLFSCRTGGRRKESFSRASSLALCRDIISLLRIRRTKLFVGTLSDASLAGMGGWWFTYVSTSVLGCFV